VEWFAPPIPPELSDKIGDCRELQFAKYFLYSFGLLVVKELFFTIRAGHACHFKAF
jgi:hypothetical protein